jgi:hypothetical protein
MKAFLRGLYHSFPIQLVILHFKKFQVLLLFWYLLFSTINGNFMSNYGAESLFLAPEYLGEVNGWSAGVMGVAIGVFIMSWNITSFILFSRHFRFLATTSNPFLKYCINNAVLPFTFLIVYFIQAVAFNSEKELMTGWEIFLMSSGFVAGLILIVLFSFVYFFRADKSIIRRLSPIISNPSLFKSQFSKSEYKVSESRLIKVEWFLNSFKSVKKCRDVSHYNREFIETIFGRHHFAAILSIFIAFLFLIFIGFWLDSPYFQLPAAAGITIFFAILIAISGAFSYFLQSWSIPFFVLLILATNVLYKYDVIDPSNKAYGLNYKNTESRPSYDKLALSQLAQPANMEADKQNMLRILEAWKARQGEAKPTMVIISTSGGGNRSANFTMNVLQHLDSICGTRLMDKTFLITGASGGMLGASYYRALVANRSKGFDPLDKKHVDDISQDLLNALFTSFVARDLASPAQKFRAGKYDYIKDRGYAFEQKLNENTRGLLNVQLKDLKEAEQQAKIPLMFFNSVVTRDGRKLIISTQPVRFLMKPVLDSAQATAVEPDAIDFQSMFRAQDPLDLRLLTALRMNATFPYVLPNVWLPTVPVIDVMDAGLRDNYGPETAVRFLQVFREWIRENTAGVLLIQIRDRISGGWDHPYESTDVTEIFTKPLLLLQYNWYKMQEYNQNDLLSFTRQSLGTSFQSICFQYVPKKENAGAALNFHLTKREKKDISDALHNPYNQTEFSKFASIIRQPVPAKALALQHE